MVEAYVSMVDCWLFDGSQVALLLFDIESRSDTGQLCERLCYDIAVMSYYCVDVLHSSA